MFRFCLVTAALSALVLLKPAFATEHIAECNFESLKAKVNASTTGDVIRFDCPNSDERSIKFTEQLLIHHSLAIDGALDGGVVTLDGDSKWRHFVVCHPNFDGWFNAVDVVFRLSNLDFIHGGGSEVTVYGEANNDGGSVLVATYGALHLDNVGFHGCRTEGQMDTDNFRGGAVFMGQVSVLTMARTSFCDCLATNQGGAVHSAWHSNTSIQDSFFFNNEADRVGTEGGGGGGALYFHDGTTLIQRSVFAGNRAHQGGAVYTMLSDLQIDECLFANNTAFHAEVDGYYQAHGGAIHSDGAGKWDALEHVWSVRNCTFESNVAGERGGAVYLCLHDEWSNVGFVYDSTFTLNKVIGSEGNGNIGAAMVYGCSGYLSLVRVNMSGNVPSPLLEEWAIPYGTLRSDANNPRLTIVHSDIPGWASTAGNVSNDVGPVLDTVYDAQQSESHCPFEDDSFAAAICFLAPVALTLFSTMAL